MKKIIVAVLALVGFGTASFAQTTSVAKTTTPSKSQVVKHTPAKTSTHALAMNKANVKKNAVTHSPNSLDRKEPKVAIQKNEPVAKKATSLKAPVAKTAGPLKKDGTADMRYKSNKKAVIHKKKDGTADKRFKENKKQ